MNNHKQRYKVGSIQETNILWRIRGNFKAAKMEKDRTIIEYDSDSNFSDENDWEDNLNQGGGSELDIEFNNAEESIEENT